MASLGSLALHCKICNKTFSGRIPATQHYSSAEHKKKQANAKRAVHNPNYCRVCNITCDTQKILDAHYQSPRHNAEVEKQRRQTYQSDHVTSPSPSTADKEYVFDGSRGYCYFCDIELTSKSHAQHHLQGQKHEKKKKQKAMLENISFASRREPVVHGSRGTTGERVGRTVSNTTAGSTLFCELCQVQFSGPDNAQQHYSSYNHRKKTDMVKLAEKGELLPLKCEVCDCPFTGQENARDHFNSTKHKRNVENKNIKGSWSFARNMTDSDKMDLGMDLRGTDTARNENMNCSYNQSMTKAVETSSKATEFDRITPEMSNLNIYTPNNLEKYQFLTKQKEVEEESIIKPYPAEELTSHIEYSEPANLEDLKADPKTDCDSNTKSFSSEIGEGLRSGPNSSMSENDEKKIQAETHSSFETGSSLISMLPSLETPASPDPFSQSDEPVRFIRNNLRSPTSMPSFGRGRAFWELKNSNALIGKLLEKDKEKNPESSDEKRARKPVDESGVSETTEMKLFSSNGGDDDWLVNVPNNSTGHRSTENNRVPGVENTTYSHRGYFKQDSQGVGSFTQSTETCAKRNEPTGILEYNQHDITMPQTFNSRPDASRLNYMANSTPQIDQESASREEFTFDRHTCRGKCYVCNIELTSTNHMSQHISGKKHISAAAIWNKARSGFTAFDSPLICTICSVQFTGPEARKQHFESKGHLQKEMQTRGAEQSYFCDICKISCSGEINFQQHIMGAQHRKKAGTLPGMIPAGVSYDRTVWYHCDVCGCTVNSSEQLELHKRSHTAKLRLDLTGAAELGATALNVDRTAWYSCKVCMVNLNTESQLRIHEQSPAHLKKLAATGSHPHFSSSRLEQEDLTLPCSISPTNHQKSGHLTPLQSFLAEELFPAEFMTAIDDNDTAEERRQPTVNPPFNLVISDSPVPFPERYVTAAANGNVAEDSSPGHETTGGGGAKRGHGSDLAFATRSRGSGDRKIDHLNRSESQGPALDTPGGGTSLELGARPKERSANQGNVNPYAATHSFYCHTCKRPMNTRESYENHLRGKNHMQKVCTEPAPIRDHLIAMQLPQDYMPKVVTSPRNYQMELYHKTMKQDSLCFLPTGTGKTLVSVLVISAMLEKYPSRNILFLVDKVLLVLQQAKYIRQELQGAHFLRYNPDSEDMRLPCQRQLQVAAVCMGQQNTHGIPLWKHDVVVVTAAFCQNLLDKEILRWEDFSLVVFDEAHHCEKAHPFNSLLKNYHNCIPASRHRPKILGLTASPAGKADVPRTLVMLESLILNMGGVTMAVVEKPENRQTLREFQSNAKMVILSQETESDGNVLPFKHELNVYILHCFLKLLQVSDVKNYISVKGISLAMSGSDIERLAGDFVELYFDVLQSSLTSLSNVDMEKVNFSLLTRHISNICMALSSLLEGGVLCMLEEIKELETSQYGFNIAKELGLPCEKLLSLIRNHNAEEQDVRKDGSFPGIEQLLRVLTDGGNGDTRGNRSSSLSLVLVKQRGTAHRLTRLLKNCPDLMRLGLKTATVVGHGGSGAADRGMSVNQQKRILEEIKEYKYQIIIATSVAEEGVDWPECERVISMYPPSTVTALVQMRGRARKKNSQFIVLCASQEEEDKLRDIMNREQNMIKATEILIQRTRT